QKILAETLAGAGKAAQQRFAAAVAEADPGFPSWPRFLDGGCRRWCCSVRWVWGARVGGGGGDAGVSVRGSAAWGCVSVRGSGRFRVQRGGPGVFGSVIAGVVGGAGIGGAGLPRRRRRLPEGVKSFEAGCSRIR